MINKKNIIIFVLLLLTILTTSIVGVDCVIIRDYTITNNYTKSLNLYPFYDIINTFSDSISLGIRMLFRNIIVGIIAGCIIYVIFNLLKLEDKAIKIFTFLTVCYLSELILLSNVMSTFSVDSIILRYLGCIIGEFIIVKIRLKYICKKHQQ